MVRPGLLLGDVSLNHPESQAFSASNPRETLNQSSEKLLQGLLLVAVVGLGLRALLAAVLAAWLCIACQHRSTSQVEGKGLEVVPLLFFGKVIINVTLKVLATTSHGLLAVKWILAGEPAGFALVASFVLVAVNTQILVTVVQVGHLRHLLLKLGLTKQARVSFAGVGSLWQVPGGRACVAVNGIATLCLVVHLHQRPWQLLPWLATACGTLVWANASFQGVGVTTWNDLKPIATDDSAVMEAEEFMESLGVAESALPDTACGKWLALVAKMFTVGKENAIMLQNRQVLMHHAFPTNPTFRFFHGVVMVLFNLCCFGVPAALVAVSMMQVPVIHDLQVSGGALYPSLSPQQSHYYVRLNDGWTEGISFTFELDVGKASSFEFCCPFCVELTGSEHGNSLILKSEMPKENLGTCQLNLFGLRFQQYQFTALALQGLEMESRLDTEIGHFEPPFQAGLQTYESSFVSKSSASISLRVVLELDMENTKVGRHSLLNRGALEVCPEELEATSAEDSSLLGVGRERAIFCFPELCFADPNKPRWRKPS
ncbi:unnamed protein product [Durusdinium trenchii]|uniref:Uncharacterized protein n=1 Tax=Durusdinium trenchii TaxID=1381693 RepID=A0ABP0NKT5_9DINO